jgi:hypothetical protein
VITASTLLSGSSRIRSMQSPCSIMFSTPDMIAAKSPRVKASKNKWKKGLTSPLKSPNMLPVSTEPADLNIEPFSIHAASTAIGANFGIYPTPGDVTMKLSTIKKLERAYKLLQKAEEIVEAISLDEVLYTTPVGNGNQSFILDGIARAEGGIECLIGTPEEWERHEYNAKRETATRDSRGMYSTPTWAEMQARKAKAAQ